MPCCPPETILRGVGIKQGKKRANMISQCSNFQNILPGIRQAENSRRNMSQWPGAPTFDRLPVCIVCELSLRATLLPLPDSLNLFPPKNWEIKNRALKETTELHKKKGSRNWSAVTACGPLHKGTGEISNVRCDLHTYNGKYPCWIPKLGHVVLRLSEQYLWCEYPFSVYMYMYMYIYMYTYLYDCIYIYIYIYICIYIYTYIHTYMYIFIYIHKCMYTYSKDLGFICIYTYKLPAKLESPSLSDFVYCPADSLRQHSSVFVRNSSEIRQHTVSIRQHTSIYVSTVVRQHTSASRMLFSVTCT